jgi:sugar lactone lactonase YvrE
MEAIAWGYTFLEAPRADGEGRLYFSDIIAGGVYRWSPDGTVETVIPKRRGVGGLVLHADGGVVTTDNTGDPMRGATVFRTRSDVPGLVVPPARV